MCVICVYLFISPLPSPNSPPASPHGWCRIQATILRDLVIVADTFGHFVLVKRCGLCVCVYGTGNLVYLCLFLVYLLFQKCMYVCKSALLTCLLYL